MVHKDLNELGEAAAQKAKAVVEAIDTKDRVDAHFKAESAKMLSELAQGCLRDD